MLFQMSHRHGIYEVDDLFFFISMYICFDVLENRFGIKYCWHDFDEINKTTNEIIRLSFVIISGLKFNHG
jgi:hypothetical protein